MNPYPRRNFSDTQKTCTGAPAAVTKYQKRFSGPILDRIDIHIEVQRVDYEKLNRDRVGESSVSICMCVQAERDTQRLSLLPQYLMKAIFAQLCAVAVVIG